MIEAGTEQVGDDVRDSMHVAKCLGEGVHCSCLDVFTGRAQFVVLGQECCVLAFQLLEARIFAFLLLDALEESSLLGDDGGIIALVLVYR